MPGPRGAHPHGATDAEKLADKLGITNQQATLLLEHTQGDVNAAIEYYNTALGKSTPGTNPTTAPPGGASSSSSGGGGGSAASAVAKAQAMANARATFLNMLHSWGIQVTGPLTSLVENAAKSGWNSAMFINAVRGTKEYAAQFPGIQWRMGMTEATYDSYYRQYLAKAQDAKLHLTREEFGHLLKKGVDTNEWSLRVQAVKQIEVNKDSLEAFRQVLVERGMLKPNEPLPAKDLKDFVTGKGSSQWTAIWNEYAVTGGLERAGISVGPGGDIGRAFLLKTLKSVESTLQPGQTVQVDYGQLAQTVAKVLPISNLQANGITKKDLVKLALNTADAPAIADRVQAVMAQHAARFEPQANPQIVQGKTGTQMLGGAQKVQTSE